MSREQFGKWVADEIDALTKALSDAVDVGCRLTSRIAALKAEVERLRKDAERYQWLRENLHRLQGMRPNHAPKSDELDVATDAAMKETK